VFFLREAARKIVESYRVPLSEGKKSHHGVLLNVLFSIHKFYSCSSMIVIAEAVDHIKMIAEKAPKWCKLTSLENGGTTVRLEKTCTLKEVKEMLKKGPVDGNSGNVDNKN